MYSEAEDYLRIYVGVGLRLQYIVVTKYREKLGQLLGIAGAIAAIWLFVKSPSFPTPDKIIIFMLFVFMSFRQALAMLVRFGPFVLILLAYDSFRSVADQLNSHVDYSLAPSADRLLFGGLPTVYFQNWLWGGTVRWYDFVLYIPYMLHFVLPIGLGIMVWKTRAKHYWRVVNTYLVSAFMAFFTFLIFPSAPPWLAAQNHIIQPIQRISSDVWFSLGIKDFPSFYNEITPNIVAAVPSLHTTWSALFSIFVFKMFGWRWGALSLLYPTAIFFGTVYMGEHYMFDVIVGVAYGVVAYWLTPRFMRLAARPLQLGLRTLLTLRSRIVQ